MHFECLWYYDKNTANFPTKYNNERRIYIWSLFHTHFDWHLLESQFCSILGVITKAILWLVFFFSLVINCVLPTLFIQMQFTQQQQKIWRGWNIRQTVNAIHTWEIRNVDRQRLTHTINCSRLISGCFLN